MDHSDRGESRKGEGGSSKSQDGGKSAPGGFVQRDKDQADKSRLGASYRRVEERQLSGAYSQSATSGARASSTNAAVQGAKGNSRPAYSGVGLDVPTRGSGLRDPAAKEPLSGKVSQASRLQEAQGRRANLSAAGNSGNRSLNANAAASNVGPEHSRYEVNRRDARGNYHQFKSDVVSTKAGGNGWQRDTATLSATTDAKSGKTTGKIELRDGVTGKTRTLLIEGEKGRIKLVDPATGKEVRSGIRSEAGQSGAKAGNRSSDLASWLTESDKSAARNPSLQLPAATRSNPDSKHLTFDLGATSKSLQPRPDRQIVPRPERAMQFQPGESHGVDFHSVLSGRRADIGEKTSSRSPQIGQQAKLQPIASPGKQVPLTLASKPVNPADERQSPNWAWEIWRHGGSTMAGAAATMGFQLGPLLGASELATGSVALGALGGVSIALAFSVGIPVFLVGAITLWQFDSGVIGNHGISPPSDPRRDAELEELNSATETVLSFGSPMGILGGFTGSLLNGAPGLERGGEIGGYGQSVLDAGIALSERKPTEFVSVLLERGTDAALKASAKVPSSDKGANP